MIELSHDEEFVVLTIRRPKSLNALNFELLDEMGEYLDQIKSSSARALIITGEGEKAFCAGADIKELQRRGLAAQREGAELGQAVFARSIVFRSLRSHWSTASPLAVAVNWPWPAPCASPCPMPNSDCQR
jgi:enoyl-CoA hydratase/carnithine racemase